MNVLLYVGEVPAEACGMSLAIASEEDAPPVRDLAGHRTPDSPNNGSPTVWLDEDDQSIVIQGWKITDDHTISEITAAGPIPDHETVVRLPARMAPFLLEVCGDDRTGGVRPAPLG